MSIHIVQAAQSHQDALHKALNWVKDHTYTPAANEMLLSYSTMRDALGSPIKNLANRKFRPLRGTGSFLSSAKNVAINYDVAVTRGGEAVSRYAGSLVYYATHKLLTPISGSKLGRMLQETTSLALGWGARVIGLVATFALRALPYLAIGAGLVFGGWKIGLALAALYAVSKVGFAFTLTGIALGGILTAQQAQIHRIGSKLSAAIKSLKGKNATIERLRERLSQRGTFSKIGQKIKNGVAAVAKRKMLLTAVILGALGLGAYYGFPEQTARVMDAAKPYASDVYKRTTDITYKVAEHEYVAPVASLFQSLASRFTDLFKAAEPEMCPLYSTCDAEPWMSNIQTPAARVIG